MRARHFVATATIDGQAKKQTFTAVNFTGTIQEYEAMLKRQFPHLPELRGLKEVGDAEAEDITNTADLAKLGDSAKAAAANA